MDSMDIAYFSEELQEMSANLMSMVAHLDAKSSGSLSHDTKPTQTLDELLTAATDAQNAWERIRVEVEVMMTHGGGPPIRASAYRFLEFSDDAMGSAPMDKGLPWRNYATDPALLIRLSLILLSPIMSEVRVEMESSVLRDYDCFREAVFAYVLAYESHRRDLQQQGARRATPRATRKT